MRHIHGCGHLFTEVNHRAGIYTYADFNNATVILIRIHKTLCM